MRRRAGLRTFEAFTSSTTPTHVIELVRHRAFLTLLARPLLRFIRRPIAAPSPAVTNGHRAKPLLLPRATLCRKRRPFSGGGNGGALCARRESRDRATPTVLTYLASSLPALARSVGRIECNGQTDLSSSSPNSSVYPDNRTPDRPPPRRKE